MLVHVVYRSLLTVDLKVFLDAQEAMLYANHLSRLGENPIRARAELPAGTSSAWVVVGPEGPKFYPTLSEAPNEGPYKPAMVVISRPVFAV